MIADRSISTTRHTRVGAALLALALALQSGCARHHRPPEPVKPPEVPVTDYQATLGRVALVTRLDLPELEFTRLAQSREQAAAVAAEDAASRCFGGSCRDAATCAFVVVFDLACSMITAPVAAKNGAQKAAAVSAATAAVRPGFEQEAMQDALRRALVAAAAADGVKLASVTAPPPAAEPAPAPGAEQAAPHRSHQPDYRALAASGVDSVLEVTLTQVFVQPAAAAPSFLRPEPPAPNLDPVLPLDLKLHVRLTRTRDNTLLFFGDFGYRGKRYKYTEWAANHAEKLGAALSRGYEAIGRDLSDRVFLLYPYVDRLGQGESGNCGLAALAPQGVAGELSPLLRWQGFPRASDASESPADMARINNVSYDLVLGTGDTGESPDIIYRREGLREPEHQLELELKPNTRYFWSARARFTLDGRERVTDWGTRCPFQPQLVVSGSLYRFYTPKVPPAR